eukprot:1158982-Pelagomonas_calceolata.AAC.4
MSPTLNQIACLLNFICAKGKVSTHLGTASHVAQPKGVLNEGKVSTLLGAASRVAQLNDALDAHDQQQEQQRKEHWKQQEQRQRKEHREQQEQQQRKEHREQQQRQLDCGVQHQPGRAANLVDHDCTAQQQQQQQQQQHKSVHCAEGVAALVVKSLSIWAPALCAEASSSAGDEDQGVGAIAPGQRKERWSKQQTGGGGGGVGRRLVKEVQRAWVLAARGVGRGLGRALPMLQEDEVEGGQEPLLGRTCVEEDGWQSHSRNGKHTQGTANTHTEPFLGQTRTDGVRCRGEEVGGVGGLESPSYTLRCHDDCQGHCDQLEQGQRQEECRQQQQQWQQQGQLQEQHHGLKHPQLGQQQAGCRQQQQEEQQQGQLQGRQRPGGRLKLLLANLDLQLQPGQRLLVVEHVLKVLLFYVRLPGECGVVAGVMKHMYVASGQGNWMFRDVQGLALAYSAL